MDRRDVVIVFTDGYVFDLDDSDVKELLGKISYASSESVWCTTAKRNNIDGWQEIFITVPGS